MIFSSTRSASEQAALLPNALLVIGCLLLLRVLKNGPRHVCEYLHIERLRVHRTPTGPIWTRHAGKLLPCTLHRTSDLEMLGCNSETLGHAAVLSIHTSRQFHALEHHVAIKTWYDNSG